MRILPMLCILVLALSGMASAQSDPGKIVVTGYILDSSFLQNKGKKEFLGHNLKDIHCRQINEDPLLSPIFASELRESKIPQVVSLSDNMAKALYYYANSDKDAPENAMKVLLVVAFADEVTGRIDIRRLSKEETVRPWSSSHEMNNRRCLLILQQPESFVPGYGTTWTIKFGDKTWAFQIGK